MQKSSTPLVDLHRHLDGNVSPATIWELAQQHHIHLPVSSLDEVARLTQIQDRTSDLLAFLQKLEYGVKVMVNQDAVSRIAYENVIDAHQQGLAYTELRFSPRFMTEFSTLSMDAVIEAVLDGIDRGQQQASTKVGLIGILSRSYGEAVCHDELASILRFKDSFCAVDLAGDERNFPARNFVDHFKKVRDAGLHVTVHAGEADGPQSVWDAIELLGAERIGHGVAIADDPRLLDFVIDQQVGIEACPTSNYQTGTLLDTSNHPIKMFLERGASVSLNTDDPGVSAIDINHEYQVATDVIGLSASQIAQLKLNGIQQAFLSI